jgi:hypothetical protein
MLEEMGHAVLLGALGSRACIERDKDRYRARTFDCDPVERHAGVKRGRRDRRHEDNGSDRGGSDVLTVRIVASGKDPLKKALQIALQG